MRYEKFELLSCKEDTFKLVIFNYNERRWEDPNFGACGEKFTQELIQEYCKHNNYTEKEKIRIVKELNELVLENEFPSFSKDSKLTPLKNIKT